MGLFDVHAHLSHPELLAAVPDVLRRASAAGLTRVISNGLNHEDNLLVREIAGREPMVRPAYGLYPVDAVLGSMIAAGVPCRRAASPTSPRDTIAWIADHVAEAIAIGEVGLDSKWVPESFWEEQDGCFCDLVELAIAADKPLIVHTRGRETESLEILVELGARRVDFHCFGGKVRQASRVASAGYYLSIPAHARKAQAFALLLQALPRDRILVETDSPYLSPDRDAMPVNEPASVVQTIGFAAELWGETVGSVVEILEDNYRRLFGEEP